MAKRSKTKLTTAAIAFIIEKRTDPLHSYTFDEIAELLGKDKNFKISITGQSVGRSYRKHKDDEAFKKVLSQTNITNNSPIIKEKLNNKDGDKKVDKAQVSENIVKQKDKDKKTFEPIEVKSKGSKDFDEDAHKKYNFEDFLIPKE